jgi:hypothetical protein
VKSPYQESRDGCRFSKKADTEREKRTSMAGFGIVDCTLNLVVDEDKLFFAPDFRTYKLSSFVEGDNLFHSCAYEGGTAGTPSAFIFRGNREGSRILHCFACSKTYFVSGVSFSMY